MNQQTEPREHPPEGDYLVVVQCHIVKERCSGYLCERAFHERAGHFAEHAERPSLRLLTMTCGGCCGRALLRKLQNLTRVAAKKEGLTKDRFVVRLSSCIAKSNHHGPPCPHLDYLRTLVQRAGLKLEEGTVISSTAERRRGEGFYAEESTSG